MQDKKSKKGNSFRKKRGKGRMSKNLTGRRIKAEKDIIIKMYNDDIPILDIAEEYGVVQTTIWRRLKNWGIKVKRKTRQHRRIKVNKFRRRFSLELKAIINLNSRVEGLIEAQDKLIEYVGGGR